MVYTVCVTPPLLALKEQKRLEPRLPVSLVWDLLEKFLVGMAEVSREARILLEESVIIPCHDSIRSAPYVQIFTKEQGACVGHA